MRYSVMSLGCRVNRSESDTIEVGLRARGAIPSRVEDADVIILNTCTVTGEAEKKTRKQVHRLLRQNPTASVFLTGCAVAIDPERYRALDPRIIIVSKDDVLGAVSSLEMNSTLDTCIESVCADVDDPRPSRARVDVKIQDGCDHACTYCIVHIARGPATSKPFSEVADACTRHAARGIKEIVLAGIDLGRYRFEGGGLASLLEELLARTSGVSPDGVDCRFRLSSIEPMSIDRALIETLAQANGRICRHLHIPLQSGSSKVLAEMERNYTADEYVSLIDSIRAALPSVAITTDIIAGFPGESSVDFAQSLEVATHCAFSKMHVFPYSERAGTPAAARTDQLPASVRSERAGKLRELSNHLRKEDFAKRIGTREWCVIESPGRAMSESYFELSVPHTLPDTGIITATLEECSLIR